MGNDISSGDKDAPSGATRRLLWLRAVLFGAFVGLAGAVAVLIVTRRAGLPPLDAKSLATAQNRWREAEVKNYTIEIEVRGAQPAVYTVAVESGEPVSAMRNAHLIKQRRAWETWSVPGMFDTLSSDIATLVDSNQVVVRCAFDPQYGYPAKYERIELGTGHQVSWKVREFRPH